MALSFEGRASDIVLFVVGEIGAGKSSFVNLVLNGVPQACFAPMKIGKDLLQCTRAVQPVRLQPASGNRSSALGWVVLVDGPGWDDKIQNDGVISTLNDWLDEKYPDGMAPRRGIVFVQSVTDLRSSSTHRNLQALLQLAQLLKTTDIRVVTMKWGYLNAEDSQGVEAGLAAGMWKKVVDAGISMHKITPGEEQISALTVIRHFCLPQASQLTEEKRSQLMKELSYEHSLTIPAVQVYHPRDSLMQAMGRMDDIVILVMGAVKSGKSTFVNRILEYVGQSAFMSVSHRLAPGTTTVQSVILRAETFQASKPCRLILVDTPGLLADNGDVKILEDVNTWIRERYNTIIPCGIIYLHDISHDDFAPTARRTFEMIPLLVKGAAVRKATLVSTKWDRCHGEEGSAREKELKEVYWSNLAAFRCEFYRSSSSNVVYSCSEVVKQIVYSLQKE